MPKKNQRTKRQRGGKRLLKSRLRSKSVSNKNSPNTNSRCARIQSLYDNEHNAEVKAYLRDLLEDCYSTGYRSNRSVSKKH